MIPCYIGRNLSTFQQCAYPGCGRDAVEETEATITDSLQYFVAACSEHQSLLVDVVTALMSGIKPGVLSRKKRIDLQHLFISPPGQSRKCRYDLWAVQQKEVHNPQAKSLEPVTVRSRKNDKRSVAVKGWTWPLNRDQWRTTAGKVVRLERLTLAELISAIFAIRSANFKVIGPTIAWTKKLTMPEYQYYYPKVEMTVGPEAAKAKLDDMYDEAVQRNLLA